MISRCRASVRISAGPILALGLALAVGAASAYAQTAVADNSATYSYQGPDRAERLAAKAREEGTLTFYTSMATTESGPLAQTFEKKYGVKVQLWRALSENVLQRALTEARGGRRSMDVVETNAPEVEALAREQVVAPFDSPHLGDLPAWAIPSHRRWFSDRANLWVTGYNTTRIKREELPAAVEGFADPNWKGRLSIEATDSDWMYGVVNFMGEQRGLDFFRKLATLKPEMRKGHILVAQLVAAGELPVCLTIYSGRAAGRAAAGRCACGKRAASARGAAVCRFPAVAGWPEALGRHGPGTVEPHAEDAARCPQIRHGRPDEMDRRGAEVGEALDRAVPEIGRQRTATHRAGRRPTHAVVRQSSAQSSRPAAWASIV
jgi:spermidine/putrescine-binding protein